MYFKVFEPKDYVEDETVSSDSELIDIDEPDDFDPIDGNGMIDSTLDIEEDDKEMNKIIAFFANMPKVTGLVQGMLDMITSLTRILPLVAHKLDKPEDEKLKKSLERTIGVLNGGIDKILKICKFLGIKAVKKPSGAVSVIVKDRFKKHKKEFIEYEIDELNKALDDLDKVDEPKNLKPIHPGDIPPDLTPNNLYPQKMPLHKPHIHLADSYSMLPHIEEPCPDNHNCEPKWQDGDGDLDKKWEENRKNIPSVIPPNPNDLKPNDEIQLKPHHPKPMKVHEHECDPAWEDDEDK